jgi:hypothetical protein
MSKKTAITNRAKLREKIRTIRTVRTICAQAHTKL